MKTVGTFIDLFAGCGGLSLGLMQAGWEGLFAIEKEKNAFETLQHNLINVSNKYKFQWPSWLPECPLDISVFLKKYNDELVKLSGNVDLIAGGPPCQGFSFAGERRKNDPRNQLFRHYMEFVNTLRPRIILIENVEGITVGHGTKKRRRENKNGIGRPLKPYSERISESLENLGYKIFSSLLLAADYGVPQLRTRYFLVGIDPLLIDEGANPFGALEGFRESFLSSKGLPVDQYVTVKEAISDLVSRGPGVKQIECIDSPGFKQIEYKWPKTFYQKLMHGDLNGKAPNSLRLAKHRKDIEERFKLILSECPKGITVHPSFRKKFGINKHRIVPLHPNKPAHTLTTLPDDHLHYSQPRILTVRECARLQSFPDWFEFQGKYTTGGQKRKNECPRYTQVGNAVPPFLGEAIGGVLKKIIT